MHEKIICLPFVFFSVVVSTLVNLIDQVIFTVYSL